MSITDKIKGYIARGAEQLSRKYRSIGVPPVLAPGQTYLELLRERDPVAWKQHEDRARSQLIFLDDANHIELTFEEFNVWLELRGCKPVSGPPAPYGTWREYWDNNDKHPVKEVQQEGRRLPNGFIQGSPEDRATWWTCAECGFRGPYVGTTAAGMKACLGSCGGVKPNDACTFSNKPKENNA